MTTNELTIKSERIDDFVLLLEIMKRLGFPVIIDNITSARSVFVRSIAFICVELPSVNGRANRFKSVGTVPLDGV